MKLHFPMAKNTATILLVGALLGTVCVLPSNAFIPEWESQPSDPYEPPHQGSGEWVQTTLAGHYDHTCFGGKCYEWCNASTTGLVPTGTLCCLANGICDPSTIIHTQ